MERIPHGADLLEGILNRRLLVPAIWVLVALPAGGGGDLRAQAAPLTVELRGGAAVPFGSFAHGTEIGEGTEADASFGVDFAFSGAGRRTATLGFSQHRFRCRKAGCPPGSSFVATNLEAGLRLNLVTRGEIVPWVRGGVLTTRVELDPLPGSPGGTSRAGFGGEVGLGVYFGAFRTVAFNPGVRITAVNTRLPGGALLRMRYWVVDLGISVAFG
ncbi:MAG: hypothetical protein ACE5GJ_07385 [Gemmatimonadota bacterium]